MKKLFVALAIVATAAQAQTYSSQARANETCYRMAGAFQEAYAKKTLLGLTRNEIQDSYEKGRLDYATYKWAESVFGKVESLGEASPQAGYTLGWADCQDMMQEAYNKGKHGY